MTYNIDKLREDLETTDYLKDLALPDQEDISDADELEEALNEQIAEMEVIYHANAMEILSKNDASLYRSIEAAAELGYEVRQINSELLATILLQDLAREELAQEIDFTDYF